MLKDLVESSSLLFAADTDEELVATFEIVGERVLEQVELFVERRLWLAVSLKFDETVGGCEEVRVARLDDSAVNQSLDEVVGRRVELVGFCVLYTNYALRFVVLYLVVFSFCFLIKFN